MGHRYGLEFRVEAVRLALTSGLTRKQLAADLGIGFSTVNKWVQQDRHKDLMSGPHEDQEKELTFPPHSGPGCKLLLDHLEGSYEHAQDLHG